MAERKVNRDYNSPEALANGIITFSSVADEDVKVEHDIRALCGFTKKDWAELPEYVRWSLHRDANNSLGDTFAGDPENFIDLSTSRYNKFAAGELGRGSGDGTSASMNDDIRALMVVGGFDEDVAREKIEALGDKKGDAYKKFANHPHIKKAKSDLREERAAKKRAALAAEAEQAEALDI